MPHYGSHQSRHIFQGIIIFQVRSLVSHHRIGRRMGFVKGVFCKINHIVVNLIGNPLLNPVADTARNSFFLIAVHLLLIDDTSVGRRQNRL